MYKSLNMNLVSIKNMNCFSQKRTIFLFSGEEISITKQHTDSHPCIRFLHPNDALCWKKGLISYFRFLIRVQVLLTFMNSWIHEFMNPWINEFMNPWIHELMPNLRPRVRFLIFWASSARPFFSYCSIFLFSGLAVTPQGPAPLSYGIL